MAEFVQLRKEKWVDTIHWLRKLEILTKDEYGSIVKHLDSHEYKIQAQGRTLDDILGYINYLCNLLKYIQKRRAAIGQYDKTDEIDRFIYNEIASQFGSAEINFGHTLDFWNARLKFIATVVPELDRENEFNRTFKKAMNYCAKGNLEFFKYCVDFQWSFMKIPPARHPLAKNRKRKKTERRDCSKIMNGIRQVTAEALRNFSRIPDASIWILTTELQYLTILKEEKESQQDIPFDYDEETEKSEKMIALLFQALSKQMDALVFCNMYEAVSMFSSIPVAKELAKEVLRQITLIRPRPDEVYTWLLKKSINENNIDEFLERMSQALSSSDSKLKLFNKCLKQLNTFLERSKSQEECKHCLPKLIEYAMKIYDPEKSEWRGVTSEIYLTSRVEFFKTLASLIESPPLELDDELKSSMKYFVEKHPLQELVLKSVKACPSSFILVKDRIEQLVRKNRQAKTKPLVILKYLSGIDWKKVEIEEGKNFLNHIYRTFMVHANLKKKVATLLKLAIKHEGMTELRMFHLKLSYIHSVEVGRAFYQTCSSFSSDWKFAATAVHTETEFCRGTDQLSHIFRKAVEDTIRLGGDSSTEPWKVCISSFVILGNVKEASQFLERALAQFSGSRKGHSEKHEDLVLFSAATLRQRK